MTVEGLTKRAGPQKKITHAEKLVNLSTHLPVFLNLCWRLYLGMGHTIFHENSKIGKVNPSVNRKIYEVQRVHDAEKCPHSTAGGIR
jgi:hypothetical protein